MFDFGILIRRLNVVYTTCSKQVTQTGGAVIQRWLVCWPGPSQLCYVTTLSSWLLVCRDRYLTLLPSREASVQSAWLADHMHSAPHAERLVLEVYQFETSAVFTSATLPGCTHVYAGQHKLSKETKCFDKWPRTPHYVRFLLEALDCFWLFPDCSLCWQSRISQHHSFTR